MIASFPKIAVNKWSDVLQQSFAGPINIACAEAVSLNVILKTLKELLHSDIEPIYAPERVGDVKHSLADISRAKEVLGYEPAVRFAKGLELAIEFYKSIANKRE